MIRLFSIFLAKLFIKDYQVINKSAVRSQYGILQGWLSIFVNLILGIVKLIIALLIGSLSLLADAIHSLSDMVTSFILIISFYWGQKPSDHEHPFGHGRIEQIGALIMAVLIGVTGIELVKAGVERVINPMTVEPSIAAFIILLGRTPFGLMVTSWVPESLSVLQIPNLAIWIMNSPNLAGQRAIIIGIGLGVVSMSLRLILGVERTYLGDDSG